MSKWCLSNTRKQKYSAGTFRTEVAPFRIRIATQKKLVELVLEQPRLNINSHWGAAPDIYIFKALMTFISKLRIVQDAPRLNQCPIQNLLRKSESSKSNRRKAEILKSAKGGIGTVSAKFCNKVRN